MDDFFGLGPAKKKRKPFPKSVIDIVRKAQGNKCAKCRKPFTVNNPYETDHKNGKNWDNTTKNCQLLHAGCHARKSRAQTTVRAKKAKSKRKKSDPFGLDNLKF